MAGRPPRQGARVRPRQRQAAKPVSERPSTGKARRGRPPPPPPRVLQGRHLPGDRATYRRFGSRAPRPAGQRRVRRAPTVRWLRSSATRRTRRRRRAAEVAGRGAGCLAPRAAGQARWRGEPPEMARTMCLRRSSVCWCERAPRVCCGVRGAAIVRTGSRASRAPQRPQESLLILAAVTRRRPPTSRERGPTGRSAVMSRRRFLELTDQLIAQGDQLLADPDWNQFRLWLLNSDELLERVWGRMDRYHLAWLNVGRDSAPPGSELDEEGTRRFVAEVSRGKLAVLRTMRDAVARQGWTLLSDDDPDAEHTRGSQP